MAKQEQNNAQEAGMKLVTVDIDLLVKHPNHPRKDLGNLETLEASIRRDGLQEPPMVMASDQGNYLILDGVRRVEVAKSFGWKEMLCLVRENLNADIAAHLSYVKNIERKSLTPIEIAGHLKRMMDKFGYTLRDLELKGYGSPPSISAKLKLLGLSQKVQGMIQNGEISATHGVQLVKLPTVKEQERMAKRIVDDDLTAKRTESHVARYLAKGKKAITAPNVQVPESEIPGVYFKDAKDMSELPDKSVHLIVTSPPYFVGMEFEKGLSLSDHWENINTVMKECGRVLVDGGIMALNVGDIHNFRGEKGNNDFTQIQLVGPKYQAFLRRHGIYLQDKIVWVKSNHAYSMDVSKAWSWKTPHTSYRILVNHDPVYIFRKKGEREAPSEEIALRSRITKEDWTQWATGIWFINRVKQEGHPAIYPDELPRRLIRMFSYIGDRVLDPFLGSGTTLKVARELGREGIGYERELQYKQVIMEKLGVAGEVKAPFAGVEKMLLEWNGPEPEAPSAEAPDHLESFEATAQEAETCADA